MQKKISLLAAYTKNGHVIGNKGEIPWQLKTERNRFKQICSGKKIIMGRASFEEIGHALPYCTIIILSNTLKKAPEGCLLAKTLEQAINLSDDEVLIAGGESLYRRTINLATRIYATEILQEYPGDRFFPEIDKTWTKKTEETKSENDITFQYILYER